MPLIVRPASIPWTRSNVERIVAPLAFDAIAFDDADVGPMARSCAAGDLAAADRLAVVQVPDGRLAGVATEVRLMARNIADPCYEVGQLLAVDLVHDDGLDVAVLGDPGQRRQEPWPGGCPAVRADSPLSSYSSTSLSPRSGCAAHRPDAGRRWRTPLQAGPTRPAPWSRPGDSRPRATTGRAVARGLPPWLRHAPGPPHPRKARRALGGEDR